VRLSPDATAVQYEQSSKISYKGLNMLANSLAHTLPLDGHLIIPVCMDVSIEFVAVLFAIMKSGNAYVTLDPENAVERNAFIVDDVKASLVFCHSQYAPRFGDKARIVHEFTSEADVPEKGVHNLNLNICNTEPAYLVYTVSKTSIHAIMVK
jgi:non-ribosomal peptide synthetase component F